MRCLLGTFVQGAVGVLDPSLSITNTAATVGQLSAEGTTPRTMEMGIRVNF